MRYGSVGIYKYKESLPHKIGEKKPYICRILTGWHQQVRYKENMPGYLKGEALLRPTSL